MTTVWPMPGDRVIASAAWMPMCGGRGLAHVASSFGTCSVMMAAMMLPVLVPMLRRYRVSGNRTGPLQPGAPMLFVGIAYLGVWLLAAPWLHLLGVALAAATLRGAGLAHAVQAAAGGSVVLAGALQFTAWKARRLDCCRAHAGGAVLPSDARSAWLHGIRLGLRCGACCGNLMLAAAVVGMMDGWAMAAVTVAIVAERFGRYRAVAVRLVGVVLIGAGATMIAQTLARWS